VKKGSNVKFEPAFQVSRLWGYHDNCTDFFEVGRELLQLPLDVL
jgi:hypothetical protein